MQRIWVGNISGRNAASGAHNAAWMNMPTMQDDRQCRHTGIDRWKNTNAQNPGDRAACQHGPATPAVRQMAEERDGENLCDGGEDACLQRHRFRQADADEIDLQEQRENIPGDVAAGAGTDRDRELAPVLENTSAIGACGARREVFIFSNSSDFASVRRM